MEIGLIWLFASRLLDSEKSKSEQQKLRILCVTTVRDEGPYLLEWIAHHRAAGVTDFLIYANDCSDGTIELLKALQQAGIVRLVEHKLEKGNSIQWQSLKAAWAHPLTSKADWVLVSDVDEFLNIKTGNRTIPALINAISPEADGIVMQWRLFGHNGHVGIRDRLVTEAYTRAIPETATYPISASLCKTLFKPNGPFRTYGVHRPQQKPLAKARRPIFVDGSGTFIDQDFAMDEKRISFFGHEPARNLVEVNHYAVKSVAAFLLKRERGLPNRKKPIDLAYWVDRNFNTVEETSISAMSGATKKVLEELLFMPGVKKLHDDCVKCHQERFSQLVLQPETHSLMTKLITAGSSEVPPPRLQRRLVDWYHLAQRTQKVSVEST